MMRSKIDKIGELEHSIFLLERKKQGIAREIKDDVMGVTSSLKPSNIIHRVVKEVGGKPEMKKSILVGISSIIGGLFSKKIGARGTSSLKAKLLMVGLQIVATRIVAKKV